MKTSFDLNKIENLGIKRLLDRNTADILRRSETGMLVMDTVSGIYMLSSTDTEEGRLWLRDYADIAQGLFSVCGSALIDCAVRILKPSEVFRCIQYAYLGNTIPISHRRLSIRTATSEDYPWLASIYKLVSGDELRRDVELGNILIGSENSADVGFIGEHLEGGMGILHVLPEYRRRGYAEELESVMIEKTLQQSLVPFCQIDIDNTPSIYLQKKLGLEPADEIIGWLWKE